MSVTFFDEKAHGGVHVPTLTYGSLTWSFAEHLNSALRVSQRAMERSILEIKLVDRCLS